MGKIALLAILYPISVQLGVQTSNYHFPVLYLLGLILLFTFLKAKNWIVKGFLTAVFISIALLVITFDKEYTLIQSIPILVLLTLIYTFSNSLTCKNTPIITKFANCVDEKPLNVDKKKYTRIVTIVWLMGFIYMLIQSIMAAIWFSSETWVWIVNIGSYGVITLIMLAEFLYRNIKFKADKISFKVFILRLSHCRLSDNK
ncbi:FIG017861: hypothetical protein [uncultured Candidatus Thioglobus sp.]|nr:FIG017861: hypothetical protein [uncultured Candidatus Thioglobus sp.]